MVVFKMKILSNWLFNLQEIIYFAIKNFKNLKLKIFLMKIEIGWRIKSKKREERW